MCGERILARARKCRFCDEIFDPVLRQRRQTERGTFGGEQPLASRLSRLGAFLLDYLLLALTMMPGFLLLLSTLDRKGVGGDFGEALEPLPLLPTRAVRRGPRQVLANLVLPLGGLRPLLRCHHHHCQ